MKIKDLRAGQSIPFLRAQIMSMKPILETENGNLRECVIEDETGTVTLTLWRDVALTIARGAERRNCTRRR